MKYPLVSAIITTHNRKQLLKEAVDSVLSQTYPYIECIVVDDASEDGTENYIQEYISATAIKYIYINKTETKGGNYARNRGILAARGEFIAFLDDDDEWMPAKIEKQIALAQVTGAGFIYCGRIFETNFDAITRYEEDIYNARKYMSGYIMNEALTRVISVTSTMMIKRDLLIDVGMFDESINAWQEYELALRVLQRTMAAVVRENLVLYRIIDNTRISNKIGTWEVSMKIIDEKYKELIKNLLWIDRVRRKLYVNIDGYQRSKNAGVRRKQLKYAAKILFDPATLTVAIFKKTIMKNGML